ncbi:MAG TPA: CDP-diacylglycerol--serine O-phosphatidyltransferase [Candidatus Norongarragalinales archaeon]|nr:CDP-diacylglycerol--serine O-phosphatidyltransferase [Candidatus Norongarragalinales archaeon]
MFHDAVRGLEAKDFLTLANGASGFMAIYYALSSNPTAAVVFVAFSAVFDYLDGQVARETHKKNDFGRELDSLSDIISFGVAPAAIVLSSNYTSLALVFSICYVCAGLVRLAAFNIQKEENAYFGLPIPAAALFAIAVFLLARELSPFALLLAAVMMVLKTKIRKPKF